jgi:hypothetical protein
LRFVDEGNHFGSHYKAFTIVSTLASVSFVFFSGMAIVSMCQYCLTLTGKAGAIDRGFYLSAG